MKKQRIFRLVSVILALILLASCTPQDADNVSSISAEQQWVLGPAVIPENNPEPVLVNREDAAVPTRISYTDKIVGEEMDVKAITISASSDTKEKWHNHIAIISSRIELQDIYCRDDNDFTDEDLHTSAYDDAFFEKNDVIMLFCNYASISFRYKIDKVTALDGRMYIYINNIDFPRESRYLTKSAYYHTFISVPKNDMKNIKDIVVYKDELFCD